MHQRVTRRPSLPRGRWLVAWFVGCAFVGGAVGAVTVYLTYTRSDAPLDLGRVAYTEIFGVLGLLAGMAVASIALLVFVGYRAFRDGLD